MSSILVLRERLKQIYASYSIYIQKAAQFLLGLFVFWQINSNVGFMKNAASIFCTLGLAVVCTFFPCDYYGTCGYGIDPGTFLYIVIADCNRISRYFPSDVYFLFQIYTGKSVADPGECIGMCVEDSIYHTGSVWTSWNSGVGCTCILWSDILLYASFC